MDHTPRFRGNVQDILACIANKAMTTTEICKECGMHRTTFRNYLQYLRSKRMIYIAGYKREEGINKPMALYRFGCEEDAPLIKKSNYTPKNRPEPYTVVPKTPRCDIAAQWMRNPIQEEVCQS